MKRVFRGAAIVLMAGAALWLGLHLGKNSPRDHSPAVNNRNGASSSVLTGPAPGANSNSASQNSTASPSESLASRAGEYIADTNVPANLPPETVLQNVRRAVRLYGEAFGGDPVGTNPEITAALMGRNPKQINFLGGQPGIQVNQNGEMIDNWGTPYFFHQLSGTEMEIRSAGPDRIMWTSDDVVAE
jgi:hypothetical protein